MFWGHICYSDTPFRDVKTLLAVFMVVYALVCALFGQAMAHLVSEGAFVPVYMLSLYTLWKNDAKAWCIGLSWGYIGPLFVLLLPCRNADPRVYATAGHLHESDAAMECIYYWLTFSDGLVTFPSGSLTTSLDLGGRILESKNTPSQTGALTRSDRFFLLLCIKTVAPRKFDVFLMHPVLIARILSWVGNDSQF